MENIELFIKNVFESTYKNVLSSHQIDERVNYIIVSFRKIPILSICKTILYSNTSNEVGKLAIDFRLNFINENFQEVIESSNSFELDNFEGDIGDELRNEIEESCIVINHFILKLFLSGNNCPICISKAYLELKDRLKVREREKSGTFWNIRNGIISKLSKNQRCFMAVFGIDPDLEIEVSSDIVSSIKSEKSENIRCKLLELLKIKHSTIDIELVQDINFFG